MPAPRLSFELTARKWPRAAWRANAWRASRALSGTTEESTIFWPAPAMPANARRVRPAVGSRETRWRVSREAEANLANELLMSMSRYSGTALEFLVLAAGRRGISKD